MSRISDERLDEILNIPLRWEQEHVLKVVSGDYSVTTRMGDFGVSGHYWQYRLGEPSRLFPSKEEAKGAAQADFDQRILSALSAPPLAQSARKE